MKNNVIYDKFKKVVINKRSIKFIKLVLISTTTEKIILILTVILLPLLDQML
jgi:hypothetical protein